MAEDDTWSELTEDEFEDIIYEWKMVEEDIVDQSRWLTTYENVYEKDGKFVIVNFQRGSTEYQDAPYEDYPAYMAHAEKTEVTKTVYEPVKRN